MTAEELATHYRENVFPCCSTIQHFYPDMTSGEAFNEWIKHMVTVFREPQRLTDTQVEIRFVAFMAGWKAGRETCGVDHERY